MNLDKEELPEHHLYYEISMLIGTSRLLVSDHFQITASSLLRNAVLESFLVHLRSLMDFLWEKKMFPDDVVADDFCENCSRMDTRTQDTLADTPIDEIDKAINKKISHLTASRTKDAQGKAQWQIREITCNMAAYFEEFFKRVDPTKMNEVYLNSMERLASDFISDCCSSHGGVRIRNMSTSTSVDTFVSTLYPDEVDLK